MKRYLLLILFAAIAINAKATFCIDWIYQGEYINFYLCQNHSSYNKTRALLFEGKAKFLSEYIKDKIEKGELQNKKFELSIHDSNLTYPRLDLSQNENGYFIDISGYPSIKELIIIVDYFAKRDWQPFFTGDWQKVDVQKQMGDFFEAQNISNIANPIYSPITIWEENNIELRYHTEADAAYYYVAGKKVENIYPTSSLPVQIKDRVIFFEDEKITVMENNKIIKTFSTKGNNVMEDYDVYAYNDWVNICWGGEDNWLYCYSYAKNQFTSNPKFTD